MTEAELSALKILEMGMARRATFTRTDREHGIHAVQSQVAGRLIEQGYAQLVTHWDGCVEITSNGREILSRYGGSFL